MARLENFGPFTFFFTLSAADTLWPENFTSLLQDRKITYKVDNNVDEVEIDDVPLMEFLETNQNKYEFIRKNLLNTTLNFQHRVKMFIKHILTGGPMKVKYHSYKIEFALRGAAHCHG